MKSSQPITLFTDPPPTGGSPSSLTVSLLLHGCAVVVLTFFLRHIPRIEQRPPDRHYTVRTLKLHDMEPQLRWSGEMGGSSSPPASVTKVVQTGGQAAAAAIPQQLLTHRVQARQTLLQPDAPPKVVLPNDMRIPLLLMSSRQPIPALRIVPPPPQKPVAVTVRPTLALPNRERRVADVQLASSMSVSDNALLAASTTSPVSMPAQGAVEVPQTSSRSRKPPTPATVMSISNVILPEGVIAVPLANETAAVSVTKSLAPGHTPNTSNDGRGIVAADRNGAGARSDGGDSGRERASTTGPAGQPGSKGGQGSGSQTGPHSGSGSASANDIESSPGSASGSLPTNELAMTHLTLPKNGKFGVVVVGSSMAEEYPETVGIWADKLAYTVYLHMGQAKNWILQYAVASAAKVAGDTRPEAPWPYTMVRPDLAAGDLNADAILVHGFINVAGRFDQLAVVYPPQFAQTKFVLGALQQWQFRPATQNGQTTAVEVLLIIPDELE